jgi:histidyl-tRNA synthetase
MDDKNRLNPVKGMRDVDPSRLNLLEDVMCDMRQILRTYGAQPLDTPVVERMNIVKELYGEEFKDTVYTLDGGENLLRYDLTMSLARYVANNNISNLKRYTFGKVYRRDKLKKNAGRYREFWQCDFDIVGGSSLSSKNFLQELEIVSLIDRILADVVPGDFVIRINDRNLLLEMLKKLEVKDSDLIRIINLIDKDRDVPENIRSVMDDLRDKTNPEKMQYLQRKYNIYASSVSSVLNMKTNSTIVFDPFLARGLDYYTGLIYEVECVDRNLYPSSIIAGGRYDNLVKDVGGRPISMIGVSFGLDRILDVMEKIRGDTSSTPDVYRPDVYVASVGSGLDEERMRLCLELREGGIRAETGYSKNPKMRGQLNYVLANNIPSLIVIAENEMRDGTVQIKDMESQTQETVDRSILVEYFSV